MAQQAALSLQNGAAVAKSFTPYQPYGGKDRPAVWLLKEGSSPLAHVRIEVSMQRNGNGTTRVTPKVIVPQVTTDPVYGPKLVCKALYDAAGGGFIIPENATQTQIDDLEAYTRGLVSSTAFKDWVKNFDPAY